MFQCNSLQWLYHEYISAEVADDLSYCFCPCLFTFLFFCVLFILIGYNYLFFVVSGCLAVTTAMLDACKLIAQMMTMVEGFPVCFWKFNLLLPVQILILTQLLPPPEQQYWPAIFQYSSGLKECTWSVTFKEFTSLFTQPQLCRAAVSTHMYFVIHLQWL